jgi:predicted nucleic acid-binding protein
LDEEGAEVVENCLEKIQNGEIEGYINVVNLTEIYYILNRINPDFAEAKEKDLRSRGLNVVPIEDNGLWREASLVKAHHSLSLADAFAVATAKAYESKLVVGSDREFRRLKIQVLKIRE